MHEFTVTRVYPVFVRMVTYHYRSLMSATFSMSARFLMPSRFDILSRTV